jgi:hypothetical protein
MSATATLSRAQWVQTGLITLAAVAVFIVIRFLPTGTNLSHMDFRPAGGGALEMCDPAHPQFIPVTTVHSPVTMTLAGAIAGAGQDALLTATLITASGKPIAPEDLLITQTKRVHLLIADRGLTDYQHIHPMPGKNPGEWTFHFTPKVAGAYRMFADFAPAATGLGLYATADLDVPGTEPKTPARLLGWTADQEGYHYVLTPSADPIRVRQPVDLTLTVTKIGGGQVPLEPVMDAFAHLVAFDEAMSGYAHIHPAQSDISIRPDAVAPTFSFKLMIPAAGRYVMWAQVQIGGRERFVPFWFDVPAN